MAMSDVLEVKCGSHVHHIPEAWLVGFTNQRNTPRNVVDAIDYWCVQEFAGLLDAVVSR